MRLLSDLKFQGTGVALVTPFKKNKAIDFDALDKIIRHILTGKCEYIVPLGTTGESATLDKEEKHALLEFVIEKVNNKIPLVLGLGGNNTNEILESFNQYNFKGVDAVLSVSPYYNKPSQQGIYEHYRLIAKASPVPVILYNVPSRTGSNITADTTLKLANEFKNIIGIKEASGNLEQCMFIIKNRPVDFMVISGDDSLTLPLMGSGADGVISVVANAYPRIFSEMVRKSLKGNFTEARKLHYKVLDVIPMLFTEGSPPGIKAVLNAMDLCEEYVRLPLVPVSKNLRKALGEFQIKNPDSI